MISSDVDAYAELLRKPDDPGFRARRNQILSKYVKPLAFETIALSVRNALEMADHVHLHSVSVPTLGHSWSDDLSLGESISAIAMGVKLYSQHASGVQEVRIVLRDADSPENRKALRQNLKAVFEHGVFFNVADRLRFSVDQVSLVNLRNDYLKNDLPTLETRRSDAFWKSCQKWLSFAVSNSTKP